MELPAPTDFASQRRIIGMFAYYSKWIRNFSEKIHPLNNNKKFPLPQDVLESFKSLKNDIKNASMATISPDIPFTVETDSSEHTIAATLNQDQRPVAFFSRTLVGSENKHHAVEKEAYAIVEAL